jgi:hypothetical protein
MPNPGTKIGTCLWFDRNAEEAAEFYVSLFADSRIVSMTRYGKAGPVRRKMVSGTFSEKENEKENGVRNLFCDLFIACAGLDLEDVAHVMSRLAKCRDEPRIAAFVDEQLTAQP